MAFVIDASVVLAWQFKDEGNAFADATIERLRGEVAVAPAIWPIEVVNAFVVGVRRGRLSSTDGAAAISMVLDLPITVRQTDWEGTLLSVLDLALTLDLSAYDASYIQLASRERLALATLDDRLRTAAGRAGVALL